MHYDFIRSAKQDLAVFAEQELKRVQENKLKLNEIRAKKKNMTLEQYQQYLYEEEIKQQKELHKELDDPKVTAVNADGTINHAALNPIASEQVDHLNSQQVTATAAIA